MMDKEILAELKILEDKKHKLLEEIQYISEDNEDMEYENLMYAENKIREKIKKLYSKNKQLSGYEEYKISCEISELESQLILETYQEKLTQLLEDKYDVTYDDYIERLDSIRKLVTLVEDSYSGETYPTIYSILGVFSSNYQNLDDKSINNNINFHLKEWFKDNDTMIENPEKTTNEELMCLGLWNFISDGSYIFEKEDYDAEVSTMIEHDLCTLEIKDGLEEDDFAENCYCQKNNSFYYSNGEYLDRICELLDE